MFVYQKCYYDRFVVSEGIDVNKKVHQMSVIFVAIDIS